MSGFDFNEALAQPANTVEKPPTLPQGNYTWTVTKVPARVTSKDGAWNIVEVPVRGVAAEDDVDPDELEAFGSVESSFNRLAFMFPTDPTKENDGKKTLHKLVRFLQDVLRVDCEETASTSEMLDASPHCQFIATASWRLSDDGLDTYVDLKNYSAID